MQITEQDIRRLAIGYLRLHYKYRPHKNWNGIQVVDREHKFNGITIDARLTYEQPDGTPFVATVEASSLDRASEVYFQLHWFRLLFEALTLALLTTALLIGPLGGYWMEQLGATTLAATILPTIYFFLVALSGWTILLGSAFYRRYRYIYAIEQFKLFHANDQWIAFDGGLFTAHDDRRFRELERQCVRYGFGMLQIERDRDVRVLIAPKRGDYFGNKRKRLSILSEALRKAPVVGKHLGTSAEEKNTEVQFYNDPLAMVEFMPPGSREERVEEQLPAAKEKGGVFQSSTAKFKAQREKWRTSLTPNFMKELPGFFVPPQGWRNWLLFALVLNLGIIGWWLGGREVVAPVAEVGTLPLEKEYSNRVPTDMELEAELNDMNEVLGQGENEDYLAANPNNDLAPIVDDEVIASMTPEPASDVAYYHLGLAGDTIVRDRCPAFGRTEGANRFYALVYGRYDDLDAALDVAFPLHALGEFEINVSQGSCVGQGSTPYLLLVGPPSTDEGKVNLNVRRLNRERKWRVEVIGFD